MSSIAGVLKVMPGGGDSGSIASQIAALNKQIQSVMKKIKELADNHDLDEEQKFKIAQMYQSQLTMLWAQIAHLQKKQAEQAEKAQHKNDSVNPVSESQANGINRPTDKNNVDVYI
ncbi:hypothetical protein F3I27_03895 [Pantoea sp. Bo_2]|uniref:FlxA protein n=3 Tax=Erwiniaceae TaxID=1903409 RepID=A0AB34CVI0_9GAMM|nr:MULTISPECIES: FlxA-like family protein [unclassified Pantoea]KAA5923938.1 hypothetical protein F3I59_19015 [Pantoea sp. VH_8]KAA5930184.1 hypothetical protein F3I58_19100 [Pantoea sp. VH_4]KAA5946691.1 hypothetical protein F3I57_09370 [Pantoea sp. VH_3]KAA5957080.1 hypothetical protein F3I56_00220 [Pantoea sp. VH_25]KAA5964632.1 hypothetical protein F3I53_00665 [Pantoea sp. VH_16]KAA5968826.1 hypothetical protein F3I54_01835 [Pantoea sp. VH_18]KAA5982336.1 hypothetical protein F3I49_18035